MWWAVLGAGGPDASALSPDERLRAQRFRFTEDRRRWTAARVLLRSVLARYVHVAPERLSFETGPHGKPAIVDAGTLRFNVSHSAQGALVAVACGREVGVDLERVRDDIDVVAIAQLVLGREAAANLERLAESARRTAFYEGWVRHEAGVKCLGVGLGGGPASPHELALVDLDLGCGYAGALAAQKPLTRLRLWRPP